MATSAEYKLGAFTFPRGWFMVADAEKVSGTPINVHFFGKDYVLYRGESGKVYMVGAYCPHMGTHIGKNSTSFIVKKGQHVEGECIRCPYHAWKFGPDGKCVEIPYFDTIPPKAALDSYVVVERYNGVFFWYDPEGGVPDYPLPEIPEWDDPTWVKWHFDDMGRMDIHAVEVVDNICDIQHLSPIHAAHVAYFETELRGHKAWQRMGGKHDVLGADGPLAEFNTFYTGPGILISRFLGDNDSMMFITHTPVDDGSVHVWHATLTRIADRPPTAEDVEAARNYQELSRVAFAQDVEIWSNKRPCFQPMQLPTDGNFVKVRTWYRQFYNPRAAVADYLKRSEGVYTIPGMPSSPHDERRREKVLRAG